uniref:Nitroreductase family protein n=1 Tax=Prevotella sp. GTC17259 TaxID=3236795 RepID=A0AB33J8G7_9BACT
MTLQEILNHRRAVRHYDPAQPLDMERVRQCIEMATLAPTSSNMQLWEAYHVTDKEMLKRLAHACLDQLTATTAQQMVVFVTRQDLYKKHAKANLDFATEDVKRNSPAEKHEKRTKRWELYYGKLMPFQYARCMGMLGLFRKLLAQTIGLFRPIVRQVSEQDVRVVVHKSCALAVQTFMLGMSEAGYDTCPVEGFDSALVKKALRLPCGTEVNMIITCGMRLPDGVWGERFRLPFDQQYHRI